MSDLTDVEQATLERARGEVCRCGSPESNGFPAHDPLQYRDCCMREVLVSHDRLTREVEELKRERDNLKVDLDGEVGFIGFRACSKVWQQRAKKAEAEVAMTSTSREILAEHRATIAEFEKRKAEAEAERLRELIAIDSRVRPGESLFDVERRVAAGQAALDAEARAIRASWAPRRG